MSRYRKSADDFQLSCYLTSNAHQTSIFHPKHPILVPKCSLSTFLTVLENFKFPIFFNLGNSWPPPPQFIYRKIFSRRTICRPHFLIFFKNFKTGRLIDPMGKSLWNRFAKFVPGAWGFPAARKNVHFFMLRGIPEPLGQILQICSTVTSQ